MILRLTQSSLAGAGTEQGGIFPGIWGYNLPHNIRGSNKVIYDIHAVLSNFELDRNPLQ